MSQERILSLLKRKSNRKRWLEAPDIRERLGLSSCSISKALRILRQSKLIKSKRAKNSTNHTSWWYCHRIT